MDTHGFAKRKRRLGASHKARTPSSSLLGLHDDEQDDAEADVQIHEQAVLRHPPAAGASTGSMTQVDGGVSGTDRKRRTKQSRFAPLSEAEDENARDDVDADRAWYTHEDGEPSALLTFERKSSVAGVNQREHTLRRDSGVRISARAAAAQDDACRWEEQQMQRISGIDASVSLSSFREGEQLDDTLDVQRRIIVRENVPPFLNGRVHHTTQLSAVSPIKDPTSDMAVLARKGSELIAAFREKRERAQGSAKVKYWKLEGAQVGAKEKEDHERTSRREAHERHTLLADTDAFKAATFSAHLRNNENSNRASALGEIQEKRRQLPIFSVRDNLMRLIRENAVVVIVGETGSGKTTQLAQYIYEETRGSPRGMIGCTQPRRVAAVSVAQRVADEMCVKLGRNVGYTIRFEDETSAETRIKFMTDGILLRETLTDPELDKYSYVIMDEAHERSLNTDILFGVLRDIVKRRMDLRVVVTSATLDAHKFSAFFGMCPIFHIPGRTHPVDTFFSRTLPHDYAEAAVRQVMQIHVQAPVPGDILVFMTGQEDIEAVCGTLAERMMLLESPPPMLILPIYSQLQADLQAKIFEPPPEGSRKVIVATNIAETSLTVDGIQYVIDSGYCKMKTYNAKVGMDMLLLCPISQASAQQRAGRAGRTGPGKCYRLYTELAYTEELHVGSVPEIQRTSLSHIVLLLKSLGISDLMSFSFMDSPPSENVAKSMLDLWTLSALDDEGRITDTGRMMVAFPLDPPLSAMLLSGAKLGCASEMLTIVAMLSVPTIFLRPRGAEQQSDAAREKFLVAESDHLTFLHVYERWRSMSRTSAAGVSTCDSAAWCRQHFINAKSMQRAAEVRRQLQDILAQLGLACASCGANWELVRRSVCEAYFWQAARRRNLVEYTSLRSNFPCCVHPGSALANSGYLPDYLVYHELIMTQKEYMSVCTQVDPAWLVEYGARFYSFRDSTRSLRPSDAGARSGVDLVAQDGAEASRYITSSSKLDAFLASYSANQ
ncbi:Pre-mRNA-splicing factor ATP-dependent RNA helicase PRP16 [Porphyridium purpureum]|uniref:RNA helicase n=1 Tax=Porphyridium purpureum TaxID=35688 RepID=A0A5J4Z845_PORPP|nr:Pre-mRNA-splicing factor ATP-dependent RNA helicase PRP16 [Porphyridium purpureum]|eukprot:POR0985..scf295_1